MPKIDYTQLYIDLDNLINEAPCKGGPCLGHQNCEYGVNGCYGEECAIETVQKGIIYYKNKGE